MDAALVASFFIGWLTISADEKREPLPLVIRAHAHNDYEHKRPLLDALDQGFCSVEADIFLTKDGKLLVAHTILGLREENTLQKLYLDPLKTRVEANKGSVHPQKKLFYLLIDIKTDGKQTFEALAKALAEYEKMLTVYENGKLTNRAVTVIISGNTDRNAIRTPTKRFAAIDGRPGDLESTTSADEIPLISASWSSQFKWNGNGEMPADERSKLKEYVAKAHAKGRMVRFWATPDKPSAWKEQFEAEVDLINTDKLAELREFLLKQK